MKQIVAVFLLILLITTSACTADIGDIKTTKTNKHTRVNGTKVFIEVPEGYEFIPELARYQKESNLYIQFNDISGVSFTQAKPSLTKEAIEAKGGKVTFSKNIKLNEYDAIYMEGPTSKPNEDNISLIFGDDQFAVMITGDYQKNDDENKKELKKIIQSVYYDASYKLDPLELANFVFDPSITNFKYTMSASNLFIYSENGTADTQNATPNAIQFSVLPPMDEIETKEYINDLLMRYKQGGIMLDNNGVVRTKINGYDAYILETTMSYDNKEGILYQVLLLGPKSGVVFAGSAYTNLSDYNVKFKKTVETIKFK